VKKFRILAVASIAVAVILSNIMCANVVFEYSNLIWGIEYAHYSAPANAAFLLAIPYIVGILICIIISLVFLRKSNYKKPIGGGMNAKNVILLILIIMSVGFFTGSEKKDIREIVYYKLPIERRVRIRPIWHHNVLIKEPWYEA